VKLGKVNSIFGAIFGLVQGLMLLSLSLNLWIAIFPESEIATDSNSFFDEAVIDLAPNVLGSDTAQEFYNKAQEIGMKNTEFNNPSGLDEDKGNYSTAYDMAILTSYAMKLKEYKKIVKTKEYKLTTNKNTYVWKNKNKLLNESYILLSISSRTIFKL
jgi:hypothetical protein